MQSLIWQGKVLLKSPVELKLLNLACNHWLPSCFLIWYIRTRWVIVPPLLGHVQHVLSSRKIKQKTTTNKYVTSTIAVVLCGKQCFINLAFHIQKNRINRRENWWSSYYVGHQQLSCQLLSWKEWRLLVLWALIIPLPHQVGRELSASYRGHF